ncbi:hypothetical protein GWK08_08030 [Leptobacterium flavescens]|uniref:Protein argonaute n=1 Tax=Leptobacterium flavescens TaxID=472055 RepID=A0A6P0ULI8_9FLAO|nr:hypothetical protein [Leptobacterium flavescens]NER13382.1 hypothetical protein [Leptobacterium flavescens]
MNIRLIEEPVLQFGNGEHIDPRQGILLHGTSDLSEVRPERIVTGFIGKSESIGKIITWLNRYQTKVVGPKKKLELKNLFPSFPGFNPKLAFKCEIKYDESYIRKINNSTFEEIMKTAVSIEDLIEKAVDLYIAEIKYLSKNKKPDVILCVLDEKFTKIIYGNEEFIRKTENDDDEEKSDDLIDDIETNFRRLLKARSMEYNIPIQIVRDRIVKPSGEMQDEATIGWNFYTALYYKAAGVPWSVKKNTEFLTCFAGISFYRSRDRKTIQTSVTQIFNENGKGVILRGSPIEQNKNDKEPHLSEEQAYELMIKSLKEYYEAMKIFPQRLVIHKSSNYSDGEIDGLTRATKEMNINSLDLVTIMPTNLRLYNEGLYPPKRGTMFSLNESTHLLYTRGFVDYYGTYPGRYIPNPIEVRLFTFDESPEQICKEILALTKMNWNNTQFDRRYPITIDCSRKVGEILKYIKDEQKPQIKYSFYM